MDDPTTIQAHATRLIECLDDESKELLKSMAGLQAISGADASRSMHRMEGLVRMREQLVAFLRFQELTSETGGRSHPMKSATPPQSLVAMKSAKIALNRKEAAEALGVSVVTLDRLVRRRLITPSIALRRPLFSPSELERFIKETR
jgi:hypothetical protein